MKRNSIYQLKCSVPFACKRDKETDKSHKERSLEMEELRVNELGQKKNIATDRRE
ncbi:hypothetical protein Bca4012_033182 [Brassica carinata]|uniref:Uncharacterized protein n=4 Tax=Brassica TaxID=3705 RepID=A0A0D3C1Z8_BRAOL|nr:unnamed protein product [Brassica napus]CAG7907181.1 unnamed protein product [Brassica rapa]VDD13225.1 unnamed protein product [Brassica oleracea]